MSDDHLLKLADGDVVRHLAAQPLDTAAWERLYAHFRPVVFSIAFQMTDGCRESAEDATQEVFTRLAKYMPFSGLRSPESFTAYLSTVCKHVVIDRVRAEARRPSPVPHAVELAHHRAVSGAGEVDAADLREFLLGTRSGQEATLLRILMSGGDASAVADALAISRVHARVKIHRLRSKLRANLEGQGLGFSAP